MSHETKFIQTSEGHRLLVSTRSGQGMPVLFLNSIGTDHTMWDTVRERLSVPSIAYDARGHGSSDIVPGAAMIEDLGRDAIAVLDELGIECAILCGLSLGGPTALQVAKVAAERVAGLVLSNTMTRFPPPQRWRDRAADLRAGKLPEMIQPTLQRWVSDRWRAANPDGVRRITKMLERMPAEGYAAACSALETVNVTDVLRNWPKPALIIAGSADKSTTVAQAEEMVETCPHASLVILDAAHISAIEAPDAFAEALSQFAATERMKQLNSAAS